MVSPFGANGKARHRMNNDLERILISEEELDLFFDVIDKIRHNIEKKERKD